MPERSNSPTFSELRMEMMNNLKTAANSWQQERDELRQENADLTEKINQLEVALGQLLKECKYLQAELVKKVTQEAARPSA